LTRAPLLAPRETAMIEQHLSDSTAWVDFFSTADLPVLRHSVDELERLRATADATNGRILAEVVMHDPLLTLRVLAYLELHRTQRQTVDIATVDRAIMMIGITPFFRDFQHLPVVEDQLKAHPQALLGLLKAINRARQAAHWARHWAILRRDVDVEEITLAAFLHDLAELLMWLFAPTLALKISAAQRARPHERSAIIQAEIYGVPLYQLKLALAEAWHLPALLIQLMDHRHTENPRVRNVKLAVDLARHSAKGWSDAALPDDFAAIRGLLNINQETLVRHLGVNSATARALLAMNKPAA
jgi:HD-like signal output (HDOD) protein